MCNFVLEYRSIDLARPYQQTINTKMVLQLNQMVKSELLKI